MRSEELWSKSPHACGNGICFDLNTAPELVILNEAQPLAWHSVEDPIICEIRQDFFLNASLLTLFTEMNKIKKESI